MQKTTATALLWLAFGSLLAFGSRATGLYKAVNNNSGSTKHKQYTKKNAETSPSNTAAKIARKVTHTR